MFQLRYFCIFFEMIDESDVSDYDENYDSYGYQSDKWTDSEPSDSEQRPLTLAKTRFRSVGHKNL